jgi:TRAP-type C4-dicarboxylate transport system permease small subunit
MAKTVNHPTPDSQTVTVSLRDYVITSFSERVRTWTPLTAKLVAAFSVWILGSFALYETASILEVQQIAAIGFWFGWLAVAATFAFVVGTLVTGLVHDIRHPTLTRYVRSRNR